MGRAKWTAFVLAASGLACVGVYVSRERPPREQSKQSAEEKSHQPTGRSRDRATTQDARPESHADEARLTLDLKDTLQALVPGSQSENPAPQAALIKETLQEPLAAVPAELAEWKLALNAEGHELQFTYDAAVEQAGVAPLLRRLEQLGIGWRDLNTRESSLEEIFVSLVGRGARA